MNKVKHKDFCTYNKDEIFNPDCPECMRIWIKFVQAKNLYISTGK